MTRHPIPQDKIIEALKATGGAVYLAARQLNCEPSTIYRRLKRSKTLQAVIDAARGEMVDIAEASLKRAAIKGDITACIWITKTLGKGRGWVERQEITGADGGPVLVKIDK